MISRVKTLLKPQNAIMYGAGGAVGSAVACIFAHEGANVFLTGDKLDSLGPLAKKIRDAGGIAEIREIDALDGKAVEKNVDEIVMKAGCVDISFNLIDTQDVQGKLTVELSLDEFLRPIHLAMRSVTTCSSGPPANRSFICNEAR